MHSAGSRPPWPGAGSRRRTALLVPLIVRERAIGVIAAFDKDRGPAFTRATRTS